MPVRNDSKDFMPFYSIMAALEEEGLDTQARYSRKQVPHIIISRPKGPACSVQYYKKQNSYMVFSPWPAKIQE